MSEVSPFIAAARRTAPSIAEIAKKEQQIMESANLAQEVPAEKGGVLDLLASKKRHKVQLTPLHVLIPVDLDNALRSAMKDHGLEKTVLVVTALKSILEGYL